MRSSKRSVTSGTSSSSESGSGAGVGAAPALSLPAGGDARAPRRTSRPKWWDPRIIGGLLLVVVAVVVGARVIGASSRTTPVWSAAHDLAVGTVLTDADLTAVDVNLGNSAARYLSADSGQSTAGRTLTQAVRAGELVPVSAVAAPTSGRVIVIGVSPDHMPPGVQHGSKIDLYLTSGSTASGTGGTTSLVASGITVQSVTAPSSGGLSGATSNRYQLSALLDPATADRLVKLLPSGDPIVVLVAG